MGPTLLSYKTSSDSIHNPPTTDEKIRIFEERVVGWQLDPTLEMERIDWSGFARLSVLLSYFEMIEQHRRGESSDGDSGKVFSSGFGYVYPGTTFKHADDLYKRVRCGLYHESFARRGVVVTVEVADAFTFDQASNTIVINPDRLLRDIQKNFDRYIAALRAGEEPLLTNFVKQFDAGWVGAPRQTKPKK